MMEKLRSPKRIVDISEPILAEDSTCTKLALSLSAVLEQLQETALHHDYLVALLLVLLAESGFRILSDSNISKCDQNTRLVHIPPILKSFQCGIKMYEICFVLYNLRSIKCKLVARPLGDQLILNMFPCTQEKKIYSMVVQTLRYVNPYSSGLCGRYMNLKEISHLFKDSLATSLRTDILLMLNLTSPSLPGLPLELKQKIISLTHPCAVLQLACCSHEFLFCLDTRLFMKKIYKSPDKCDIDHDHLQLYNRLQAIRSSTCLK